MKKILRFLSETFFRLEIKLIKKFSENSNHCQSNNSTTFTWKKKFPFLQTFSRNFLMQDENCPKALKYSAKLGYFSSLNFSFSLLYVYESWYDGEKCMNEKFQSCSSEKIELNFLSSAFKMLSMYKK